MEVREPSAKYLAQPSFQRTGVGRVPTGWVVKPLGKVATLQRGFDLPHRMRQQGDVPIVTSSGTEATHNEAKVRAPGVVTGRYGTIGQVFYVERDFWPLNTTLYVRDFHGNNLLFVSYLLRTIDFDAHSGKSGVPGVNRNDLHQELVPLPPSEEQQAIATALSDADALIESLEQLLAKKRQIKQGAMQELLTGKRRLPGFEEEWEEKRLDQLGRWVGGMTPSMKNPAYWDNGAIPWISSGDVKSSRLNTAGFAVSDAAIKDRVTTLIPENSVVVVMRSGILRNYFPVAMNMIAMAINQDIKAIIPVRGVLPDYLLHVLIGNGDRILSRCLKSGTTVESIEFRWLKALTISLPSLDEQTAIATVLSDMDADITAHEAKLTKARAIKQGMMQELLTGRIRLV